MATFVLVTGAWHGSWCWKRVREALTRAGHAVFTPTFTGIGERSHLLSREVDLETHVADVMNLIRWEELKDVVLVGHSYGGLVVRTVADRMGDRIAALVYLDAFVPENGQSVHDLLPDAQRAGQLELARNVGDGWKVPPIPAEVFNVNLADRDWVDRQCTMHPLATFQQPLTLNGQFSTPRNTTFILAERFGGSPFQPFYERARALGWTTMTVACGHDVMLDEPQELTNVLAGIAATRPAAI